MLDANTVRKLNRQIEDELRTVDSALSSHQDKMEALERITKLKELLTPQPNRKDILRELATALQEKNQTPSLHANAVSELLSFLNRR
jgi:hypothetical protein